MYHYLFLVFFDTLEIEIFEQFADRGHFNIVKEAGSILVLNLLEINIFSEPNALKYCFNMDDNICYNIFMSPPLA